MKIYVFASTDQVPDWLSKSIMKALKTNYSHVGFLVYCSEFPNGEVFHSTGDGTNHLPRHDFINLKKKKFIEIYDITPYILKPQEFLGWMKGECGKDYSETQYIAIISKMLKLDWISRWFKDGKSERICSEYVDAGLNLYTDLPGFRDNDSDLVTPKEVIDNLKRTVKGISNG